MCVVISVDFVFPRLLLQGEIINGVLTRTHHNFIVQCIIRSRRFSHTYTVLHFVLHSYIIVNILRWKSMKCISKKRIFPVYYRILWCNIMWRPFAALLFTEKNRLTHESPKKEMFSSFIYKVKCALLVSMSRCYRLLSLSLK